MDLEKEVRATGISLTGYLLLENVCIRAINYIQGHTKVGTLQTSVLELAKYVAELENNTGKEIYKSWLMP